MSGYGMDSTPTALMAYMAKQVDTPVFETEFNGAQVWHVRDLYRKKWKRLTARAQGPVGTYKMGMVVVEEEFRSVIGKSTQWHPSAATALARAERGRKWRDGTPTHANCAAYRLDPEDGWVQL